MIKKKIIYIFAFWTGLFISNGFAQIYDDYPRNESCIHTNIHQVQTDSFYYYYGKAIVAIGTYETHCRLLCGGKSSVMHMYGVPINGWIFYYTNGTILAKGGYKVNSKLGKDNRGSPETHYFAEKTGTWLYYDIGGKTVDKIWVESALEEAEKNLRYYILNIDLK